jgi:hypothetical protein
LHAAAPPGLSKLRANDNQWQKLAMSVLSMPDDAKFLIIMQELAQTMGE